MQFKKEFLFKIVQYIKILIKKDSSVKKKNKTKQSAYAQVMILSCSSPTLMFESTEYLKNCKRSIPWGTDDYKFHDVVHKYIINSMISVN